LACTLGFGHRDKEEEGPIGFLAGGSQNLKLRHCQVILLGDRDTWM